MVIYYKLQYVYTFSTMFSPLNPGKTTNPISHPCKDDCKSPKTKRSSYLDLGLSKILNAIS
jgi:hypothetical protein